MSSWKIAFTGAESISSETLDQFAEAFAPCGFRREAFYPCYGLAEATLFVTGKVLTKSELRSQNSEVREPNLIRVDSEALQQNRVVVTIDETVKTQKIVSCGQPTSDETVIIVDPETLLPCSPEKVGEIWVSGASVAQGYWQQKEITEATFKAYLADTKEGTFLRTGDLGFLHDGELFVTGRLKDVIIIRGHNYYPKI